MNISATQINMTAVKVDCNCNAVSLQGDQGPAAANDFTSVLKAILSDLSETGLLTNQNGQPIDINELANGLLSDKDLKAGQDKSLTDMLQQLMAQLQMTGHMPGMVQPVIVNVTQNNHSFSFMAGNSDILTKTADNAPVLVVKAENAGSLPIQLNNSNPDSVSAIKNEVNPLLQSKAEQNNSADGFKGALDPLLQSEDAQNNNGVQVAGLKNSGDLSLQSKDAQNSGERNAAEFKNVVSNLADNITVANADKVKLEGMEPDFYNDLSAQTKIASNEEGNALKGLKVTDAETGSGTKELNGPVTATAQTPQSEYGKNPTSEAKETVHISRLSELSEPIAKNLASGNSRLTIKLTPPELGNIHIKLRMENGVLKADFMVDSNSVKDLFSTAIPQIKTSLEDSGIKSGDFYVNLKKEGYYSDGREHQGSDNFNRQQQKQQRKTGSQFYDFFA